MAGGHWAGTLERLAAELDGSALQDHQEQSDRTEATDIEVIEAFTASKSSARPNEDAFFVGERLAAVIDGATDKSGLPYDWQGETVTSGRFATLVVAAALAELDTAADPPTAAEAVALVSERLDHGVLAQRPDLLRHHRPACAVVVYSEPHREVWSVGDCSWAADGVEHRAGLAIDDLSSAIRAAITEAHLDDGWSIERLAAEDPGRAAIQGVLEHQALFANRVHELGYGVVNGTAVPAAYLHVHDVREARTLTLASDGYPELLATREASDRRLAELLRADPLCIGVLRGPKAAPGPEAYDDRTWLSLRLDG